MYSPAGISRNPQEHSSNITPPGAASVVIYTLKMTELPPGVERKMIIQVPNYVDLFCFYVLCLLLSLCLYQRFLSGPFRGLFQWFLARFCIHI